jgi:hypothetical protein
MASREQRGNREKKKPKADKDKKKNAPPASPFASARSPGQPVVPGPVRGLTEMCSTRHLKKRRARHNSVNVR